MKRIGQFCCDVTFPFSTTTLKLVIWLCFCIPLFTARYAYEVDANMRSPQVQYVEMPPPYEAVEKTDPMTKEGLAKMEAAREA